MMRDLHGDYLATAAELNRELHLARKSAMDEGLHVARLHIAKAENAISHFIQEHSESGLELYEEIIHYSWFSAVEDTSGQLFGGQAA